MAKQKSETAFPSVLAFSRGHAISDARMYSLIDSRKVPIPVIQHGMLGTQNTNDGKGNKEPWNRSAQKTAESGESNINNPQMTESAKLDGNAHAMLVEFSLHYLDLALGLHSCHGATQDMNKKTRDMIEAFLKKAKSSQGIEEVARRYARNILNGRWLWRNRKDLPGSIEISVRSSQKSLDEKTNKKDKSSEDAHILIAQTSDTLKIPLIHFDDFENSQKYLAEETKLTKEIAEQMRGNSQKGLKVSAKIIPRESGDIEVFPSQNYIAGKPKNSGYSRSLYKVGQAEPFSSDAKNLTGIRKMGEAAIRDQKVSNAIRTIDTWYPMFKEVGQPIPIEPLGASIGLQEFYRCDESTLFEMLKRLDKIDPNSDEGQYCIACFDRGGVFGAKGE
jgi:CRISPR-associated protein Csy3